MDSNSSHKRKSQTKCNYTISDNMFIFLLQQLLDPENNEVFIVSEDWSLEF